MLRKIAEIKDFLLAARLNNAKSVKIKKNKDNVKFKVWCSRYFYTLFITDEKKSQTKTVHAPRLGGKKLKWTSQTDVKYIKKLQKFKKKNLYVKYIFSIQNIGKQNQYKYK